MESNNYSYLLKRYHLIKNDRRVNKRYGYDSMLKIVSINDKKLNLDALGVDLSICGIGFILKTKVEVNDMLEIIFKYDKITIPAIINVLHINLYDQGYFVGGQFIALQNMYRELLKHYLSNI